MELDKSSRTTYSVTSTATISPSTISAGTNSIVTITGTGFGASMGTVGFKWADDGGTTYQLALASQIQSWMDTGIYSILVNGNNGTNKRRIV